MGSSATPTPRTRARIPGGLIGLLIVAGAATVIGRTMTGRLHRAVAALQGLADSRLDQRRLPTTRDETGDVVEVTTSTAQQAQLLALDAAIDAARAGAASEVPAVAGDVEALARETAKATEDIARRVRADPPDAGAAVAAIVGISEIVAQISDRRTPVSASLVGLSGVPRAVTPVRATVYAAARSRAQGPTTALWHAVQLQQPVGVVDRPCELTVCGSLVRVSTEQRWPVAARGVCPACATLAH